MGDLHSVMLPCAILGQDDGLSPLERTHGKTFERLSSHDQPMSLSMFPKPFEVFRQLPRNGTILTNDILAIGGIRASNNCADQCLFQSARRWRCATGTDALVIELGKILVLGASIIGPRISTFDQLVID